MMKRALTTGLFFALLVTLAGCGAARPPRYYSLEEKLVNPPPASADASVVLVLAHFTAPHVLRDDRIVYGMSAVEMGAYEYHRWAEPPAEMVENLLIDKLRGTGQYKSVQRLSSSARGAYVLRGQLVSLNEVDDPSGVVARFGIRLELFQPRTGLVVWTGSYSHDQPVGKKSVSEVVEALQKNVQAGLGQLAGELGQYFASHPEK